MIVSVEAGYCHIPMLRIAGEQRGNPSAAFFADSVLEERLPIGVTVRVLPYGIFFFDLTGWSTSLLTAFKRLNEASVDERLEVRARLAGILNVHLACLYTALHRDQGWSLPHHMIVTATDIVIFTVQDNGIKGPNIVDDQKTVALDLWLEHERNNRFATDLSLYTIRQSLKQFGEILDDPADYIISVVDLYLRASISREQHDHVVCLTLAWAAVEKLLQSLWTTNFPTAKTSSAAKICQELLHRAIISQPLFDVVSLARKARNSWLHDLKAPNSQDSTNVLKAAYELLAVTHKVQLSWPFWLTA
jgi:hypothetical protein